MISEKKAKRKAEFLGTYTPDAPERVKYGYSLSKRQETLLYGITRGLWAIPKSIILTPDGKEEIYNLAAKVKGFLNKLKMDRMDLWLQRYPQNMRLLKKRKHPLASVDLGEVQILQFAAMSEIRYDWSKKNLKEFDLIDHLGMSELELINRLIDEKFLPEEFWEM